MAAVKIYVHVVWGTKNRYPYLTKETREILIRHIKENAREKGVYILEINGYHDHLHCLLALNADMTIAKAVNLIKGESSFWINKNKITRENFKWAAEYYAASVSKSDLPQVVKYIQNQEEHHAKKMFIEVYEEFMNELSNHA